MAKIKKAAVKTAAFPKPLDVVKAALKHLSSRDADIIARRHGLKTGERETLEEIGRTYQLTRERIRQIETTVINKLRSLGEINEALESLGSHFQSILESHGHAMEEGHFLDRVLGEMKRVDPLDRHAVTFLAKNLLENYVAPIGEGSSTRAGWKHSKAPWELFEQTVTTVKKILSVAKEPMPLAKLLEELKKTEFYKKNEDALAEEHVISYLKLSQELHHNAFSEWGMSGWGSIHPRRMADKIHLILKKAGAPLHFQDITANINEAGFPGKKAYSATVHNELILDKRFVLVGRGLYGLAEWGYKPGVVADIIADVLKSSGQPMQKESIIKEVLKQRIVKPATVNLALMNKKRFKKVAPKTYYLAS